MIGGLIDLAFQLVFIALLAWLFLMFIKNFDSKQLLENYKFDIKKAKDIS